MAITTYAELKTAIENYSIRSDSTVTNRADEYIDLTEAAMMRGMEPPFPFPCAPLRARQMETRNTSYTIDGEYIDLPTGFLEHVDLYLDTSPRRPVEYVAPQTFDFLYASTVSGSYPDIFTIIGSKARFAPAPTSSVTGIFTYYQEITPLDSNNTTNWVLTDAPHVYLYGCLMFLYMMTDQEPSQRTQAAAALFSGGINSLNTQEQSSRHGRTMVARTLTGMP